MELIKATAQFFPVYINSHPVPLFPPLVTCMGGTCPDQKKRAFDLLLTIPGISECLRFRRSIDIRYMRIFLGKS